MKNIYFLLIFFILGCGSEHKEFVEYDFKIKAFDWDSDPYKFTSYIQDSILHSEGAQKAAWEFSYIGDIKNMHEAWDNGSDPKPPLTQEQKDSFALLNIVDAKEFILEKARDHQVVIINEAHHMPQHRVFTTQLLAGLKKQGFKHLGLETYFASEKNDSALNANGYPIMTTGYYTKEPQFGNLVRVAHQSGYSLFGYESQGHDNGKEREINQAERIKSYIEKHPNEKILIHAGFDHGYEGDLSSSWEKAMAGRLTEFTGIDPLTINQTIFSERSKVELENPYYQLIDVQVPSVFVNDKDQSFGQYKENAWFDISVYHPRSEGFNRPKWMVYGDRKEVDFFFTNATIDCPCMVLAYKEGEEVGSAVPYDIQVTESKQVKLVLDNSNYEIIILNEKGKALKAQLKN